jgi:arylsulfatase I/J
MKSLLSALFLQLSFFAAANNVSSVRRTKKPHIMVVMVDDLGWSSVGFNLQQPQDFWTKKNRPQTPNIDKLAKSGVILSSHYAGKMCAPSRSSFISGRLPIHVNQINHKIDHPANGVPLGMSTIAEMLKTKGYSTHQIGKWHLGLSSPDYLPTNRGFDSALTLLGGSAHHFMLNSQGSESLVDLWLNNGPAGDDLRPTRADGGDGCTPYSDVKDNDTKLCKTFSQDTYMKFAKDIISKHDANVPMFMFLSLQMPHGPLQVPTKFLDMYKQDIWEPRRYAYAMISSVDDSVKELESVLQEKDMWDNTLLLFTSDNGGPREHEANYPLRAAKATDFEGGVRVASFLAGGFVTASVPKKRRGKRLNGMMHICDWWSTFAGLAGHTETSRMIDPRSKDDAKHGREIPYRVKRVDSLDMWPYITGAAPSSPRTITVLSAGTTKMTGEERRNGGMIWGSWKLVVGPQLDGSIPRPTTPDESDSFEWEGPWETQEDKTQFPIDCGAGCLFNLADDEGERSDLRYSMAHRKILKMMQDKFKELTLEVNGTDGPMFQSYSLQGKDSGVAKRAARQKHNMFWGPWLEKLPENAWEGFKINGGILEKIENLTTASACKEACAKHGDGCKAGSFFGVTASSSKSTGCTLFKGMYHNPKKGVKYMKEHPHAISGVMKLSDLPAATPIDPLPTLPDSKPPKIPGSLRQRRRRQAPASRRRKGPEGKQRRRRRRRREAPTKAPTTL